MVVGYKELVHLVIINLFGRNQMVDVIVVDNSIRAAFYNLNILSVVLPIILKKLMLIVLI